MVAAEGMLYVPETDPRLVLGVGSLAIELFEDRPLGQKIMRNGRAMDGSGLRQGEQYVKLFRRVSGL